MSCNNTKLKITSGDTKNLRVIISKGDKPLTCKLTSDISGTITSVPITVKNSNVLVPGSGHVMLYTAGGDEQILPYTSVTEVTSTTYTLTVASTVLLYDFFANYKAIVDGGRVDITSDTITFEAIDSDDAVVITKVATIYDGPAGVAIIELEPTDTAITVGEYTYSIEWETSLGAISTLVTSILEILEDVVS